jgi:hypothetical protein
MVRKLITTLCLGAFAILATNAVKAAANDCTLNKAGADNPVIKACKAGGIKEAKKTMKAMVAAAKKKGKKFECDSCHKNEEDWKLTDDGEKKFQELLAASK